MTKQNASKKTKWKKNAGLQIGLAGLIPAFFISINMYKQTDNFYILLTIYGVVFLIGSGTMYFLDYQNLIEVQDGKEKDNKTENTN